jgi:hypothetical protein
MDSPFASTALSKRNIINFICNRLLSEAETSELNEAETS